MLEQIHQGTTLEIRRDGETVRDFLYIDDMVSAMNLLIDMPTDDDTYNIATCTGLNLNQVKDIVEAMSNKSLKLIAAKNNDRMLEASPMIACTLLKIQVGNRKSHLKRE